LIDAQAYIPHNCRVSVCDTVFKEIATQIKAKLSDLAWTIFREEVSAHVAVSAGSKQQQQRQLRTTATRIFHRTFLSASGVPPTAANVATALTAAGVSKVLTNQLVTAVLPAVVEVAALLPPLAPGSVPDRVEEPWNRRKYDMVAHPTRYVPAFAALLRIAARFGDSATCGVTRLTPSLGSLIPAHTTYDVWALIDLFKPPTSRDSRLPRHMQPAVCLPGTAADWRHDKIRADVAREVVFQSLFNPAERGVWPTAKAQRAGLRIGDSFSTNGFSASFLHISRPPHEHGEVHGRLRAQQEESESYVEGSTSPAGCSELFQVAQVASASCVVHASVVHD
jgi:hypothetical protein